MAKKKDKIVIFKTTILKFGKMGEKTGWTYINVPADVAEQLMPSQRKSFRVKGKLDQWKFEGIALLPMGDGDFIMTLNAVARKGIGKRNGAEVLVELQTDHKEQQLNKVLMECLEDETVALTHFNSLTKSHKFYISKWIDSAKSEETIARRIGYALDALNQKKGFPDMMKAQKLKKL
ncbi:MAG: YdeI/OmpD-associated family protein [Bacteroidota bacterium]